MEERPLLRAFDITRYINRYVKIPCRGISFHRGPVGKPGLDSLARAFERKGKSLWVHFLDPEDIKILCLWVIWNFGKGTRLS
jgi:hypothetical protein